jgi:hypothetical protein
MELPDDILNIIKEYSRPVTRSDWRKGAAFNRYSDEPITDDTDMESFKNQIELGFYVITNGIIHYGYEYDDPIHRWYDIIKDSYERRGIDISNMI